MESYQYKLLIGAIGDDAHSVGIRLLELGFREAGFFVKNIGIRNTVDQFFEHAGFFDIILISNKNGHADLYLERFSSLLKNFELKDDSPRIWYLGGSLSVSGNDFAVKKHFLSMGFTNVYPKPIVFEQVVHDITRDIHLSGIRKKYIAAEIKRSAGASLPLRYDEIIDRRWTQEELLQQRKQVLQEWHTGADVLTADTWKKGRTLDEVLWKNKLHSKIPLFQPRTGVADIDQQIELLQYLETAGSDVSSVQMDAASRSGFYDKAQQGRDASLGKPYSVLNGFPVPVYGVEGLRKLISSLKKPFQLRAGGPDHRLAYEIAIKAGATAVEGGFLCYLMPYDKLCNPVTSLNNWQYIDRLCAQYELENKRLINREYFGVLTATLIEPSLAIVVNIIQSILSAQQGCRSIAVGYAEQGNRSQDIAAIQVMNEMVLKYLHLFKYRDCRVTTVFHQYMAAFPSDYKKAEELIFNSSITATHAGATKVMVKTPVEAINIPDRYENEKALHICKQGALMASLIPVSPEKIRVEKNILRQEVKEIMDVILELGNFSIAKGAIKAVATGIIDIPWSPNAYNNNQVMGIRDVDGAVRFLDFGNIPFSRGIKDFHLEKVNHRKDMERDPTFFSLLEKDLSRIWKNDYSRWPLDDNYVI